MQYIMRLQLFSEGMDVGNGGDVGGDVQAQGQAPAEEVAPETPDAPTPAQEPSFDEYIKAHKEEYQQRLEGDLGRRLKGTEALKAQVAKVAPLQRMLAERYGVDAGDLDALTRAMEEDSSYYEDEAMRRGMSVEQLKELKRLERDNRALTEQMEQRQQQEQIQRRISQWRRQEQEAKALYPELDLAAEMQGESFRGLLEAGVDVRTAYQVVHQDELQARIAAGVAQTVAERTASNIAQRGARPAENGVAARTGAATTDIDPSKLDAKGRAEFARRIMTEGPFRPTR